MNGNLERILESKGKSIKEIKKYYKLNNDDLGFIFGLKKGNYYGSTRFNEHNKAVERLFKLFSTA